MVMASLPWDGWQGKSLQKIDMFLETPLFPQFLFWMQFSCKMSMANGRSITGKLGWTIIGKLTLRARLILVPASLLPLCLESLLLPMLLYFSNVVGVLPLSCCRSTCNGHVIVVVVLFCCQTSLVVAARRVLARRVLVAPVSCSVRDRHGPTLNAFSTSSISRRFSTSRRYETVFR